MSSDAMRVVVVGCGAMAREWIRVGTSADSIEVVGLVDLNREAAEGRAQEFGLPGDVVFDSLAAAVAAAKPDAVFDVTVPVAHDKVTVEALGLGCHVLGEKPMSDDLGKAQKMVGAAKAAGKRYGVTQTRRPHGGALAASGAVRDGVLGDIQEVHADFYVAPRFGGFRAEMDYPLILDMAIHTFDSARQLGGLDPVSVYCYSWNPGRSWYKGDASAVCIFEMQRADGVIVPFTYRGSWTNEGLQTDWNADWRLVGQKGTLHWDGADLVEAEVVADAQSEDFTRPVEKIMIPPQKPPYGGHETLLRQFADVVRNGGEGELECDCEDNIKSLAMVSAAVESAKCGERVPVRW